MEIAITHCKISITSFLSAKSILVTLIPLNNKCFNVIYKCINYQHLS